MLEEAHSISDDETHYRPTIPQIQSGYTMDDGMYKSMYSRYEERDVECRPHRGGRAGGVGRIRVGARVELGVVVDMKREREN